MGELEKIMKNLEQGWSVFSIQILTLQLQNTNNVLNKSLSQNTTESLKKDNR